MKPPTKAQGIQVYQKIGEEPYTRLDGNLSKVITWRTECPKCGAVFSVKSGQKFPKYPRRRCEKCRRRCGCKPTGLAIVNERLP